MTSQQSKVQFPLTTGTEELHHFVLDYLKRMYQKFAQEIERRKRLIAQGEAERTKKYSAKSRP
jgi:hypothetical protein